jgi:hypothetical protein
MSLGCVKIVLQERWQIVSDWVLQTASLLQAKTDILSIQTREQGLRYRKVGLFRKPIECKIVGHHEFGLLHTLHFLALSLCQVL